MSRDTDRWSEPPVTPTLPIRDAYGEVESWALVIIPSEIPRAMAEAYMRRGRARTKKAERV